MCWHGGAAATTLAEHAREWHRLGARLIGGCCRTTPADIQALRSVHSVGSMNTMAAKIYPLSAFLREPDWR